MIKIMAAWHYMKIIFRVISVVTRYLMFLYFLSCMEKSISASGSSQVSNDLKNKSESTTKTILLWNKLFSMDHFMFGTDASAFIGEHRCPVDNCIVTNNRDLMPVSEYDVIVFHLWNPQRIIFPVNRSENQFYSFVSLESPRYLITKNKVPKDFFNWTITYRLDSDFPWPYFKVIENDGSIVAPSLTPRWHNPKEYATDIGKELLSGLNQKSKKVAWFASRCNSVNHREDYVKELQKYIEVDVYGVCGPLKCPKAAEDECFDILKKDYYFYLAFENSNYPDYVTEKVLNALQHDTVPIVFGGADYTRFLPPDSYINAKDYKPKALAQLMEDIIVDKNKYAQFFWWKKIYNFHTLGRGGQFPYPYLHPFCDICKALNDPNLQPRQYHNIRMWWNANSK